ncbi:MAG: amylo-alpha-1,6-glucosidase [Spirochaetota bacterium]
MINSDAPLRNLIPCDSAEFPFVDDYSQFGVVFEAGRPLGPGEVQVRSSVLYQSAADALLTLYAEAGDGTWVPVVRRDAEHLPWCVTERGDLPALAVTARHVFLDERRLLSEFVLYAPADGPAGESATAGGNVLRLQLRGQFARDAGRPLRVFGIPDPPPRENWAEVTHVGTPAGSDAGRPSAGPVVTGGLDCDAVDEQGRKLLPGAALRISLLDAAGVGNADDVDGNRSAQVAANVSHAPAWLEPTAGRSALDELPPSKDAGPIHFWFEIERGPRVGADASAPPTDATGLRLLFLTELSATSYLHAEHEWRGTEPGPGPVARPAFSIAAGSSPMDAAVAAARERFAARAALDSPPTVDPLRRDRAWRARWALLRTGYRGTSPAGEFGELVATTCVPTSGGFTRAFFWDAFFTSAALSTFEPGFAKSAIAAQFVRQLPDGHCPEHVFNYNVAGRSVIGAPQAPVASWAVGEYLARHDDPGFLASIYPTLVTNHAYWTTFGDRDRDGLAEWTWSGQTSDSGPIWDEFRGDSSHSAWVPPVASVQLNAFLYRDAMILAEFADRLGRDDEAVSYRAAAAERHDALMRHLYVPEEKRFWDYFPATRRHTRVRTFYMFWPIWADMPIPADAKRDLIENELLNPEHFFGAIPFPSVAYSEPTYENKNRGRFWRGTAWPQITYWLLQMLVREGYAEAAEVAANRFLAACDREPSFPEHIASDPRHYLAGGTKDYNWGVAAYLLVSERRYRERATE